MLAGCLSMATMSVYWRALRRGIKFWPTRPAAPVTAMLGGIRYPFQIFSRWKTKRGRCRMIIMIGHQNQGV